MPFVLECLRTGVPGVTAHVPEQACCWIDPLHGSAAVPHAGGRISGLLQQNLLFCRKLGLIPSKPFHGAHTKLSKP